jgi:hypothetical protein
MGWVWEESAFSVFPYIRGWTWAEFGKMLPFLSSLILEAGHGLSMGRGCHILLLLY